MKSFKTNCGVGLFAAMLCLFVFAATSAKAANIDYSDSQYDYTWTDADGTQHTSHITDDATDPYQILALFKKVYLDPRVPGIQYGDEINDQAKIDYDLHSYMDTNKSNGRIQWLEMGDGETVQQPDDGMAVLYVEVKPDFYSNTDKNVSNNRKLAGDIEYVSKCYQLVKFIPSYMRVTDEGNPGYLFTLSDAVASNRFFFVSKGRWRSDSGTTPLWGSFEEISPNDGGGTSPTTSLADELEKGSIYTCIHSCGSVPSITQPYNSKQKDYAKYGHEFVLDRETGNLHAYTGLSIFIPERRLTNATGNTAAYNKSYPPASFLYKAYLTAKAEPAEEKENYYKVTLDWETSMTRASQASKLNCTVNEQFYVYIVNADGTYTLIDEVDNSKGGDPDYKSPVKERTHSYLVPMQEAKQEITFIITANPLNSKDEASTILVNSNTATVVIPGLDKVFFMRAGEYRSKFDVAGERNLYRNTVSISPQDWNKMKNVEDTYVLRRVSSAGDDVVLATVKFSDVDVANKTAKFTVTYNADAESKTGEPTFDDVAPLTSAEGTLTATSDIVMIDRFLASTANNEQPTSYTYTFYSVVNTYETATSDPLTIPVYTTPLTGNVVMATKDEVDADTDFSKTWPTRVKLNFNVVADASGYISTYEALKVTDVTVTGSAKRSSNSYILVSQKEGQEVSDGGTVTTDAQGTAVSLYGNYEGPDVPYCVRINTKPSFDGGLTTVDNSYGSSRQSFDGPSLDFTAEATGHSSSWWASATTTHAAFSASLALTPTLPEDVAMELYLYRVWRQNADGTYTLLNTCKENTGDGWGTTYSNLYENLNATTSTDVSDVYVADEPTGTRTVTYVARMYSKYTNAEGEEAIYYVNEKRDTVEYKAGTVTGLEQVAAANQVQSVTYYSITGQQSVTPWQGVNIMVTRYANGTSTVSKVLSTK